MTTYGSWPRDLLAASATPGERTMDGLRLNINVGIAYVAAWLAGNGAAAIHNLMEDAATAEISRSQIWQWTHNAATLSTGETGDPRARRVAWSRRSTPRCATRVGTPTTSTRRATSSSPPRSTTSSSTS